LLTPTERSIRGAIGAEISWANTEDRPARTAPARKALDDKFLAEAGGDPIRAQHFKKAYYKKLALKSALARRRRSEAAAAAPKLSPASRDDQAVVAEPLRPVRRNGGAS
jgi:hypothetical protein